MTKIKNFDPGIASVKFASCLKYFLFIEDGNTLYNIKVIITENLLTVY